MKLLLDTHLLLWAAGQSGRLSPEARKFIDDPGNELLFSAASLWEVVIKRGLGRDDFKVDARVLRRGLLDNGYLTHPFAPQLALHRSFCPLVREGLGGAEYTPAACSENLASRAVLGAECRQLRFWRRRLISYPGRRGVSMDASTRDLLLVGGTACLRAATDAGGVDS